MSVVTPFRKPKEPSPKSTDDLIEPHGGELLWLYADDEERASLDETVKTAPRWSCTPRQLCDLELLLNGAFSPLTGFMGEDDYQSVCQDMRLKDGVKNGVLWPIPITLDVDQAFADNVNDGDKIVLCDIEGVPTAVLTVGSKWKPSLRREAVQVYGSEDQDHPGVAQLLNKTKPVYIGGDVVGLQPVTHYDFKHLRDTPHELRARFKKRSWRKVVAFQTRNPMHRAHHALTLRAAKQAEANLLIHPVVGQTKPGDIDHFTRVRCYEAMMNHYPEQTTLLSLLPLAMRMAGPREALWHAIIRKNYGCTHIIIGRDHAGPGNNAAGEPFYGPYDAQALLKKHGQELGIAMVPFQKMVYVEDRAEYVPVDELKGDEKVLDISGTEVRRRLSEGLEIPEWFSYPEVVRELQISYRPQHKQGFTVFFTGLSGAGKSTIANALRIKLLEAGGRRVTLLDGDIVRKNLSQNLGFSKEDRDINIERIGFVASEITKHGGIAICAPIAPYRQTRRHAREIIEPYGGFIEVFVSTPLEVCEQRDRKGLYAKARAGEIKDFTGIDDPYETPEKPELNINTADMTPDQAAHKILLKLETLGFIGRE